MQNDAALPYAVYRNGSLVTRYLTYPLANGHVLKHGKVGRIYDATDWHVTSDLPYLSRALVSATAYSGKVIGPLGSRAVAVYAWEALDDLIRRAFAYTNDERATCAIVVAEFSNGERHVGTVRLHRQTYTTSPPPLGIGHWLFPQLCGRCELYDVRGDWPELRPGISKRSAA